MAQNNNSSQSRQQPNSYASSHSYPSPPMQSTYAYPPPNGQHPGETYRDSPPGANLPLPSINQLAPLRAHDGHPQPHHQTMGTPTMSSGLPPGMMHGGGYYPPPSAPYNGMSMPMTASPNQQAMSGRFPMAGPPGGMMSAGRNKKEIKRRTKTGCLTCRKRRIKCDEAHPVCRNCQKSKRECMGYDPMFKQQSLTGSPAELQPALTNTSSASPIPATSETPTSTFSSVPQGYAPASINSPSPSVSQSYDYNSAIDPALAGSDSAALSSANAFENTQPYRPDVKGDLENGSPYSAATTDAPTTKPKRTLKIDDLFMTGDDPPTSAPSKDITPQMNDEIKNLYNREYAKGIDAFLETTWYSTKGLSYLLNDTGTCELFQSYVEQLKAVKSEDYDGMRKIPGQEARVVWALMSLARTAATEPKSTESPSSNDEQLNEVTRRLGIFEHLITGHILSTNPLAYTHSPPGAQKDSQYFQTEFWRLLGKFVSHSPEDSDQLNHILASLRLILRQHENRDVLYSMAIVRHYGADTDVDLHAHDQDRQKVGVAKTFIENEAAGQGTTQVIQRLCGMAARSWVAMR